MSVIPRPQPRTFNLSALVGVGDKIGLVTLPFLIVGIALNIAFPFAFRVAGPPIALEIASIALLALGLVVWAWSVVLILTTVPRGELISSGPYRVVKHPLYAGVALLVLPSIGFLLNTWLGLAIGIVMYVAARHFAPREESELSSRFGSAWGRYTSTVILPWL
jgi:protein-S-isoprenylcysteine O-methyltransferase Ste14